MTTRTVLAILVSAVVLVGYSLGQVPCKPEDITAPKPPEMIDADLGLVRDIPGKPPLPEWSKIEKLKSFYASLATSQAPCSPLEGEDLNLRLFVSASSLGTEAMNQPAGLFSAEKSFQFYGFSRLRIERTDQEVTRQFALPVNGPAKIAEVVQVIEAGELGTFLEDLAQLQLVMVPRVFPHPSPEPQGGGSGDCYKVANVSVVPTRVFDPLPGEESSGIRPSLDARRRLLENVVLQTAWLRRFDTEQPGCGVADDVGYLDRQITSLNLTLKELIPDLDFMAESVRFWNDVENRIELLRAEEQGWKKQLREGLSSRP